MALSIAIPGRIGVDLEYHHIGAVSWQKYEPGVVHVTVNSFVSEAARVSGAAPVEHDSITLPALYLDDGSVDLTLPTLYGQISQTERYLGAEEA